MNVQKEFASNEPFGYFSLNVHCTLLATFVQNLFSESYTITGDFCPNFFGVFQMKWSHLNP